MTLNEYKKICSDMLANVSQEPGAMPEFYFMMGLSWLYELAADVPFEKSEPFLTIGGHCRSSSD
jgi:hypothetical protein